MHATGTGRPQYLLVWMVRLVTHLVLSVNQCCLKVSVTVSELMDRIAGR